jgi:hypothetical protein
MGFLPSAVWLALVKEEETTDKRKIWENYESKEQTTRK